GYAVYRRRDTGVTAVKSSRTLDNRCVVPYNRDLVVKYQAHINVEVCHRGQLIKYLFKYITKGPDRSSPVQSIVGRPGIENTMLTQWFSLNKQCPSARKYTYDQIPNAFVFIDNCEDWTPRKKGFVVGRIPMVPAAAGDIFYLRILLGKVYGTQSFRDLRTYNGVIYRDYQETCQAMGLLATDDEWHLVMSEVNRWWHPSQMRYVISKVRSRGQIALVVASLGIVAALLPDGLTAHSRFKILLNVDHSPTCMVKKGMTLAELLKAATLIVWDEAPMVHRLSFEVVDRTLCDIMNIPTYFSADSLTTTGSNKEALEMEYHIEFLNSLSFNGIPEHDLKLKPFSTVMLLRNLNPLVGLCNGTQILLTNLGNHLLQGLIVGGTMKDSVVAIPCIVLDVKDGQ
ncbi:hypothetical protein LINPERHAP2_LOCUS24514, partial [Linum perenne]